MSAHYPPELARKPPIYYKPTTKTPIQHHKLATKPPLYSGMSAMTESFVRQIGHCGFCMSHGSMHDVWNM